MKYKKFGLCYNENIIQKHRSEQNEPDDIQRLLVQQEKKENQKRRISRCNGRYTNR